MFVSCLVNVSRHLLHPMRAGVLLCIALCAGCQTNAPGELASPRSPRLVILDSGAEPVPAPARATLSVQGQDIWARVGRGTTWWSQVGPNARVAGQVEWLVGNPRFLAQASRQASPYLHLVMQSLQQRGLPPELALLPMIESAYNPVAVSPQLAVGLWQFMPATATDYGLRRTAGYDGRRDVMASTQAAMDYLERLHTLFEGDWLLALAAYNAGEGTVGRAMEANRRKGLPTDYWHLSLPRETSDYVPRLLALSMLISDPGARRVPLQPVVDEPYVVSVALPYPVALKQLAAACDLSESDLRMLNPAYLQGSTQDGPGHVLVPVKRQQPLLAYLSKQNVQPSAVAAAPAIPAGVVVAGVP
jgi:membrane-bound lytic murein transglycosylase D